MRDDPLGVYRWRDRSGVEIAHRCDLFYCTRKDAGGHVMKHTEFYAGGR